MGGPTFGRTFCMEASCTFNQLGVKKLLEKYIGQKNRTDIAIVDPFARDSEWGTPALRNDLNPETKAANHMDALQFTEHLLRTRGEGWVDIILFDPPFSENQIAKNYQGVGSFNLYTNPRYISDIKANLGRLAKKGALAISFAFNSSGQYKKNGWEIEHIQLFTHGSSRNDLIVTVDRKV